MPTMESGHSNKDCRTCRVRRIRCDRTVPHCSKCTSRGLGCPGYGAHLRWTNAIASRGRNKGLAAPRTREASCGALVRCDALPASPPPALLSEAILDQLMHYYSAEVAPLNVWVESRHNEYRRLVLPLARKQRALRLAMGGIAAAAHRPTEDTDTDANKGSDNESSDGTQQCTPKSLSISRSVSQSACQEAMRLVTGQFRKLASMDPGDLHAYVDADMGPPNAVLATTLVLTNYSLLRCELPAALLHLQGARGLIRTLALDKTPKDGLFVFIRNQVAAMNILACTTLFSSNLIWDAVLPDLDHGPVLFGEYLLLIHGITVQSVDDGQDHDRQDHTHRANLPPGDLEDAFELARGATLVGVGQLLDTASGSYRHDVVRLVQTYHHAGLLYAHLRLSHKHSGSAVSAVSPNSCTSDASTGDIVNVSVHRRRLFQTLGQFDSLEAFAGSLAWPILIAGLSIDDNEEQKETVRRLCGLVLRDSPFRYYAYIETFVEQVWDSPHRDWTIVGREWEDNGAPLVAV